MIGSGSSFLSTVVVSYCQGIFFSGNNRREVMTNLAEIITSLFNGKVNSVNTINA